MKRKTFREETICGVYHHKNCKMQEGLHNGTGVKLNPSPIHLCGWDGRGTLGCITPTISLLPSHYPHIREEIKTLHNPYRLIVPKA